MTNAAGAASKRDNAGGERTPEPSLSPDPQIVRLTAATGLYVHGRLTAAGSGSLHLESAVFVHPGTAVEVSIPSCVPFQGRISHCKRQASSFQIGVFFTASRLPQLDSGAEGWAESLAPLYRIGYCSVLDKTDTRISLTCRQPAILGSWIRLELGEWVLFGEVTSCLPPGESRWTAGVHLDAAFVREVTAAPGREDCRVEDDRAEDGHVEE